MNLKNKKVLVTGACGFIGSHLTEALLEEGCKVTAFVYYNSFNSWGWLDTLPKDKLKNIRIFSGDVRDPNGVRTAVKGADVVFHLAALIGIPFSYHSPDSYVDTNIKGTLNVLQASRDIGVGKVIITSTSEVYGTARYTPIDEEHPLRGQSPYSASKIAADKIAESFYLSFNLPVAIARPFNTYGPRQSARAIIPAVISQILGPARTIKLGNTAPMRDMTFVDDVCRGFVEIAREDETVGKVINICSGKEISMGDLANSIIRIMNSKKRIEKDGERVRPAKSEVMRLVGDNSRINSLTGWKPGHTLEKGLRKTVDWFKINRNLNRVKSEIYNI